MEEFRCPECYSQLLSASLLLQHFAHHAKKQVELKKFSETHECLILEFLDDIDQRSVNGKPFNDEIKENITCNVCSMIGQETCKEQQNTNTLFKCNIKPSIQHNANININSVHKVNVRKRRKQDKCKIKHKTLEDHRCRCKYQL